MLDRYFSPPSPGIRRKPQRPFGSAGQDRGFMPKPRNLPITTREPISDAKAREFLLPSSSWGSHRYWHSSHREEPWVLGYIAYIGYYRAKNLKNGSLRVWLVTFWWRVRCWVLIGSRFPGWPGVLIGSISPAWSEFAGLAKGSDWFAGGGVRSGDFQRLLDFQRLFSQNLTKWSNLDFSEEEMTNFLT